MNTDAMVSALRTWATDPEFPSGYAIFKVKARLSAIADEVENLAEENKRLRSRLDDHIAMGEAKF